MKTNRSTRPHGSIDIRYVADLARLELTEEEILCFSRQLDQIVRFVEKIQELDLRDIKPLPHPLPLFNVMRPDRICEVMGREKALKNAPQRSEDLFLVPRVVE